MVVFVTYSINISGQLKLTTPGLVGCDRCSMQRQGQASQWSQTPSPAPVSDTLYHVSAILFLGHTLRQQMIYLMAIPGAWSGCSAICSGDLMCA
jgi:hypothetical protein